jgi:hypothetical protein
LFLVDALCRAWGAQEHGPGLLVWAELPRGTDTAPDPGEPRADLGWGARPKPGRPDDSESREDRQAAAEGSRREPARAEGSRREPVQEDHGARRPERQVHTAPAEDPYRTPGQCPHRERP